MIILSNSGRKAYGIQELLVSSVEELPKSVGHLTPGSTVQVLSTGETYILNEEHRWTLISIDSSQPVIDGDEVAF